MRSVCLARTNRFRRHLLPLRTALLLQLSLLGALLVVLGTAGSAAGFCGFFVTGADTSVYNSASQVVLLREGSRTFLTMSNDYKGPPEDFALVIPVPVILKPSDVKTLEPEVLRYLDKVTAPRLVEYWEQDPCVPNRTYGTDSLASVQQVADVQEGAVERERDLGVRIEAKFASGEYQILILSAKESSGLETWLRREGYKLPKGAAEALMPYVREQMKFFVAKVNIKKVRRDSRGTVVLSPLRMSYESSELRLPVRLGLLNASGPQDLLIYVLHPEQRFEVANYANVSIPTNLEVSDAVREDFGGFYGDLFDAAVQSAGGRAVVTEYVWQSVSCDPCPVPPIPAEHLLSLGAAPKPGPSASPSRVGLSGMPRTAPLEPPTMGIRVTYPDPWRNARDMTPVGVAPYLITRLHARYNRATLAEDLIFKAASPIFGGRAGINPVGEATQGASFNSFQARYVILHDWKGPAKCATPRYGRWGAQPAGSGPTRAIKTAVEPASAVRGHHDLGQNIRTPVPSLGIVGDVRPRRSGP